MTRKWDKLLPPVAAALRRHVGSVATERTDIAVMLWANRRLQHDLSQAHGVLNQVDAREHIRALDAWRAQRERLRYGIDIADFVELFSEEDA